MTNGNGRIRRTKIVDREPTRTFPVSRVYNGRQYLNEGVGSTREKAEVIAKGFKKKGKNVRIESGRVVKTGHRFTLATGKKKGRAAVYVAERKKSGRKRKQGRRKTTNSRKRK